VSTLVAEVFAFADLRPAGGAVKGLPLGLAHVDILPIRRQG
jgi:hypothetical protein